tara:strand:- start:89 stop:715 length:627 start_codon:yes stop_codon:yes gene_type:complete
MNKFTIYLILVLLWFNPVFSEEKNLDLSDRDIIEILEKMEERQKTKEFLQCVEIVRGSNVKRRFLRHQIKKIQCRLKYEELNANFEKEEKKVRKKQYEILLKEAQIKQQEIEKNKPKLINLEKFEVTDYESLFYLTKVKLFNNDPNIVLKLKNEKYLNFKPDQFISFDDIIVLSEEEFFKLPLKYSEEKLKFRKIIFEFKKEKKKRKF